MKIVHSAEVKSTSPARFRALIRFGGTRVHEAGNFDTATEAAAFAARVAHRPEVWNCVEDWARAEAQAQLGQH